MVLAVPVEIELALNIVDLAAALCPGVLPLPMVVTAADTAHHQLVRVHAPAVPGLLQRHRALVEPALVQGRAGILHQGGHHHLGIGVSYVGQIGGLPALFQLVRKYRDGDCRQHGDDGHDDQKLRQRKAVFSAFHGFLSPSLAMILVIMYYSRFHPRLQPRTRTRRSRHTNV